MVCPTSVKQDWLSRAVPYVDFNQSRLDLCHPLTSLRFFQAAVGSVVDGTLWLLGALAAAGAWQHEGCHSCGHQHSAL
jgi:hypothetical protein